MNKQTECIIFALNRESVEQDLIWLAAYGIDSLMVKSGLVGRWDGQEENSYLVTFDTYFKYSVEFEQAWADAGQAHVLHLDEERKAFLLSEDSDYYIFSGQYIGRFVEVPKAVALMNGDYTHDTGTNLYYIAK